MDKAVYEGYTLNARPHQLADNGRWTTDIESWRDDGNTLTVVPYSAANSHESKEAATWHSLNFGRQIIDGEVPGCSAP